MTKNNHTKIGNENFKIWLKRLDPVARVEKMSNIAKTQASAGLKGSLIRVSLAQLSQRCQVMLIRLSDEDIKFYTRKTSVKRLQDQANESSKLDIHKKQTSSAAINDSETKKLYQSTSNADIILEKTIYLTSNTSTNNEDRKDVRRKQSPNAAHHEIETNSSNRNIKCKIPSKLTLNTNKGERKDVLRELAPNAAVYGSKTNELYQSTSSKDVKNEETTKLILSKSKNKEDRKDIGCKTPLKRYKHKDTRLEERYKELFGDFDDIDIARKKVPKLFNISKNCNDDKVNNFLSTTVNVNIYNATSNTEGNNAIVNRTTHSRNYIDDSDETCNNQLRIDVSLPKNGSNFVEARSLNKGKRKSKTCTESKKSKKKKRDNNQSKHHNSAEKNKLDQIRSDMKVLSALQNEHSDDDPVKELWKIFGMESPTDRSESIIKSYPQILPEMDITNREINIPNVLSNEENVNEIPIKETGYKRDSTSSKETTTSLAVSSNSDNKDEDQVNNNNVSFNTEPFCKIVETFSLAELNPGSLNDYSLPSKSPKERNGRHERPKALSTGSEVEPHKIHEPEMCSIETISLCDDDDEENLMNATSSLNDNDTVSQKLNKNQNKVGTIRVKDLGLLLDPQKIPDVSSTPNNSNCKSQHSNETTNSDQESRPKFNNEDFFDSYSFYFDELLESKILKLGELLHLAVSDEIRRKERIKRAEQLSSIDLIQEEIERANKDFIEMMKVRGSEFAPLVDLILKKFLQGSKVTLFFCLFIRIFERAKEIDTENGKHIFAAKEVVNSMLSKTLSADHKAVSKAIHWSDVDFLKQVQIVTHLLRAFNTKNSSLSNAIFSKDIVPPNTSPENSSLITNDYPPGASPCTNIMSSGRDTIPTHSSNIRTPCAQLTNSVEHVNFQKNSMQSNGRNGVEISSSTDGSPANSFLHKPTLNQSEYVGTSKQSTNVEQPQKSTNAAIVQQNTNPDITISSILSSSVIPTSTVPHSNASAKNLVNPPTQTLNGNNTHALPLRNIPISLSTSSVSQRNTHYISLQNGDLRRNVSHPRQIHSVFNRLGMDLNSINEHQEERAPPMAMDISSSPSAWKRFKPNTLRTGGFKRTPAKGSPRIPSTTQSDMIPPGMSPPAATLVSSASQRAVHTQPSHLLIGNPHANYSNTHAAQRPRTSNLNPYNSPSATTSSPDVNNITGKTPTKEPNNENHLEMNKRFRGEDNSPISTNSCQRGSTSRQFVCYSDQVFENPNNNLIRNTNENSLEKSPNIDSNQYNATTNSKLTPTKVISITTANGRNCQMKPGVPGINNSSITTDPKLNSMSISNPMNVNIRSTSSSVVENPLSKLNQLITKTSKVQQYNSTTKFVSAQILSNMLTNNPGTNTTCGNQYPVVTNDNYSTTTNLPGRNVLTSTNSSATPRNSFSLNSRAGNAPPEFINVSNPLRRQSNSNFNPHELVLMPNSSTKSLHKGTNSIGQQKIKVIGFHTSQMKSLIDAYCGNQSIQSSPSKTLSEPHLKSIRRMPVATAKHSKTVLEPAISLPRLSTEVSFPNQQELICSTSTRSTLGHPAETTNLPSSPLREPRAIQPVQPDMTQPTVEPSQSLPTSSHCHPFVRRMPISGKMKMFFGNK